jgi:hypothetical protein
MKQALISPNEKIRDNNGNYLGERVAQVEPDKNIFPVASPLYWMPCEDYVTSNDYYFDTNTNLITKKPETQSDELIDATEIVY